MEPCPFKSKAEQISSEFDDDLNNLSKIAKDAAAHAKTLFESKKPLNKSEKDELLSMLNRLSTEVSANIPFVRKRFDEQMHKSVAEAKGNIEGYVQNRMSDIANTVIARNMESAFISSTAALLGFEASGQIQPKNCKRCGGRMVWENPHIPGHYHASSNDIPEWDICNDCMVEHCCSTDCSDCEYGTSPDCRFFDMKQNYMSDD
jgi:hypothetical protein